MPQATRSANISARPSPPTGHRLDKLLFLLQAPPPHAFALLNPADMMLMGGPSMLGTLSALDYEVTPHGMGPVTDEALVAEAKRQASMSPRSGGSTIGTLAEVPRAGGWLRKFMSIAFKLFPTCKQNIAFID